MSDDALIRLINLKSTGVTAKQLEAKKIGRYTYCRDLLTGRKSFGEKAARKIEEAMGWPRGCLDTDGGCQTAQTASTNKSTEAHESDDGNNADRDSQTIPTYMSYSPRNLNSTILLLGSLLGALDQRSRQVIGGLLKDLAENTDDAEDIANKAAALATTQKPLTKNKALEKAIRGNRDAVETDHAPLREK